ncbi:MAG: hypothetical protein IH588_10720 [Anaerolineales bacterium]|nr:hypothetical protein [Anaerolineales bacterium]
MNERARMKEPERENWELERANKILKSAAAFFGAELDRRDRNCAIAMSSKNNELDSD